MSPFIILTRVGILFTLLQVALSQSDDCQSYGVDIQNNATVFVNVMSNDNFTFVEEFSGCQNASAQNYLIDPAGDEYECTDTDMDPANTAEMSTW
jgi:hypothetical protein